ncbi:MAG: nitrogenase iron-molybdenum cofactor biosynthesis protein NifE [Thermodesulfovibrionales bacterium]|nr:nitrogenase iron-molybdenum cofactor biosynthesis protein NifE [Thermodesulfovibrionales bacterium]
MLKAIDRFIESECKREKREKVCRTRGGESCAFDGALIVLQPIADSAHIIHGPIGCCSNSWEGRGTLSTKARFHKMGFTTDMAELDIVFGSDEKLYNAILDVFKELRPNAIFVYSTCVSGLIGENIEAVCKKAETDTGIRVIPVNAPGFLGPKNLGNRIAGDVLLDHVIGTGEPDFTTDLDINLIGEYNIAGDLWYVEPILREAGIRILSRITGDSTFKEITYAHRARLNVLVCSRALINVAREMEKRYGIPYVEVSFFGKTEMSRALRLIARELKIEDRVEKIILREERALEEKLSQYSNLKGKKAVLYTGGVKSWSFISALMDLGINVVAVGTKKSTFEDEEKMKNILQDQSILIEDVTPSNLVKIMRERGADMLIAGGRNQYLAIKEGFPFVDVNQERHRAYAGYRGLVNLADSISNSLSFYSRKTKIRNTVIENPEKKVDINPLKHSQSLGAVMALQGIDRALPVIHGAQGCTFLAKVLLTKHFKEPVSLVSTKLFVEDVVMDSEEKLIGTLKKILEKNSPDLVAILTSALTDVKGEDILSSIKKLKMVKNDSEIIYLSTPDYEGGLETGYAKAVESMVSLASSGGRTKRGQINVLGGLHLTPLDYTELRDIIESFGLEPVILPDLSALDGSREGFSSLATGGTRIDQIRTMGDSEFTIVIGASLEPAARILKEKFNIEYMVFESLMSMKDFNLFLKTLSVISGKEIPHKYERQKRILIDAMRDGHFYLAGKKVCLALESDSTLHISELLDEAGLEVELTVIPSNLSCAERIKTKRVLIGSIFDIKGEFDLIISNSHAEEKAKELGIPLYEMGFPVYKSLGNTHKLTIGYRGALSIINDLANIFIREVHK